MIQRMNSVLIRDTNRDYVDVDVTTNERNVAINDVMVVCHFQHNVTGIVRGNDV